MRAISPLAGVAAATLAAALFSAEPAPRHSAPLPDPLLAPGGTRVTTAAQWTNDQRGRVLELFRTHVYGRTPLERPPKLTFAVREESATALGGNAKRKVVRIAYGGSGGEGHFDATLFAPAKAPARGVFVLIVNRTRELIANAEREPTDFWPVDTIVARGYAAVAFHNSDLARDNKDECFDGGVFKIFGPAQRSPDSWGALGAWAWGASRVLDYLETDPDLKGKPVAVLGHSRGGKAALWCGAQDQRVALTISNDSGQGGAALSRRTRGETVEVITRVFTHWFAPNYRTFANREMELPLDQHMLLALMAPRLAYVASAHDDSWADPAAEFGSAVAAGPVYRLFGREGVGAAELPADNSPRHAGAIGHHIRPGGHNLLRTDWNYFMDFADRHWPAAK